MAKTDGKWIDANSLRYVASLSWTGESGSYSMSVPASTHGRGLNPIVQIKISSGGSSSNCTWDFDVDDDTGDVLILSNENFSGKLVIL
jgi:hypothetical protein